MVVPVVVEDVEVGVGCVIELPELLVEVEVEFEEPDPPWDEYHPLFCRNGYQSFPSEASAPEAKNNSANNMAAFRNNIFPSSFAQFYPK